MRVPLRNRTEGPPRFRRTPLFDGRAAAVTALLVVVAVGVVWGFSALMGGGEATAPVEATVTPQTMVETVTVAATRVEVPSLTGMSVDDARTVLKAAGLGGDFQSESRQATRDDDTVVEQDPPAGAVVDPTATVALVTRPAGAAAPVATATGSPSSERFVVCIDPGHQAHSDSGPEPVGPKSKTTKPRVTGGATGVVTQVPEYEVALQIAMNLKERLEARGVKVVMTRTVNDVLLSNAERAQKANKVKADVFVRVHCAGSPRESTSGVSTLYAGKTRWTRGTTARSKRAARLIQAALIEQTGAVDRGVAPRTDFTGFNWARMPSVLVECGFLTNRVEDRLLTSPHYQDKLAQGMAEGIMVYLEGRR